MLHELNVQLPETDTKWKREIDRKAESQRETIQDNEEKGVGAVNRVKRQRDHCSDRGKTQMSLI